MAAAWALGNLNDDKDFVVKRNFDNVQAENALLDR
jgi:hypothetical protein